MILFNLRLKNLVSLVNEEQSIEAAIAASQTTEQNLQRLVDLVKNSFPSDITSKENQEFLTEALKTVQISVTDLIGVSLVTQ